MSTGNEVHAGLQARQFSLAGMLSMVFACAVYFGLLRITGDYLTILDGGRSALNNNEWLPLLSIFICWLAFGPSTATGSWNRR